MTLPIVAVAWALIQVTILCLIVLVLAQLVRGRSPQIMTSLLSGACVGCLALAASIFLPATHWSISPTILKDSQLATKTAASAFETQLASDAHAGIANASASGNEQLKESSPKLQASLVAFRIWAARKIQGIEHKMRTADIAHSRSARFWTRCGACVLAGCGAMWTVWFYSFLYTRRLVKSSCLIEDERLIQLAMRLACEMGLHKTPGLRASASIPVGATGRNRQPLILGLSTTNPVS